MSEELRAEVHGTVQEAEVHGTVQEAVIKTIPKEKKCKMEKWLPEKALQITVKRREVKGKGEKEIYSHLNPEFQRTTRRDKKAFLSDQCKEIEENNRIGKTRDLFKKIRDTNDFILGGSKSLQMVTAAMKFKDACSLEEKL